MLGMLFKLDYFMEDEIMSTGFRIYFKVDRPEKSVVESFKGIPVANIADSCSRFFVAGSGIKAYNDVPLVGTVITVKTRISDNLLFHKALDMAEPGDVIVVDASGDCVNSLTGEIMMRYAIKKGIVGFVINGAIRDVKAIREFNNFSVFAKGVTPRGPYKDGPGEINVPIVCGGVVIKPGDIVVGDHDGLVVISKGEAKAIQRKSKEKLNSEVDKFRKIEEGTMDKSWVDEKLKEKGCEFIYD